ncbi:Alpha/Beta hydrolase protein [Lasiosphaeris hirsuta]|uniref:Alpha/Beta hydrolase protein n=1 Tax=Lasiosphaeris hirsuta TaxID=260670 RepID=A0AA40A1S2_9PEZI|nr:Alpha/Beta hydrolase protein [Lasiosphaeris hirsuta]
MMEKLVPSHASSHPPRRAWSSARIACTSAVAFAGLLLLVARWPLQIVSLPSTIKPTATQLVSPYGRFPLPNDPFQFVPCTTAYSLPPLDDSDARRTWSALFDPNPDHWRWGAAPSNPEPNLLRYDGDHDGDRYAGRGIHLCGYLDLPLDYLSNSDSRIVRLAVAKFQVSGLSLIDSPRLPHSTPHQQSIQAGAKSERTIVVEPGGPGASGIYHVWTAAENITERFSQGQFDVLGWDPRGVEFSLPSAACFPHNVDRDRWSLLTGLSREDSKQPRQLDVVDAMNNATFYACQKRLGDFGRFVSTASVARDLEEIRKALMEEDLTAYFISYGTGIAQTYVNTFPDRVGRVILDGCQYIKDQRQLAGFGMTSLDNVTDAWRDGFLGECAKAGSERCALARPLDTVGDLETRMSKLFESILARPASAYTEANGPSIITYSSLLTTIYDSLYDPRDWPATALLLSELEAGNSTLAAVALAERWGFDTSLLCSTDELSSDELFSLVVCADSYDAPQPDGGLEWWGQLWANMTSQSWISGNSRFLDVFACRHFTKYWPHVSEVYRGHLNHTLANPVLLISTTYDPATPLRNGRRLLEEMGQNAKLVVHHGYGHTSRFHRSDCTDSIGRSFILNGTLPAGRETNCFADKKPYQI